MTKEDYLRLKALKEENDLSWAELIEFVKKIIEKDARL